MSIDEVTFYRAVCDGCGARDDGVDPSEDPDSAIALAIVWQWEMIDGALLCRDCVWSKDDKEDDEGGEA